MNISKANSRTLYAEDITQALQDNYNYLLAQGDVIVLIVNEALEIQYLSSTVCDMLHYDQDALIDKSILSIVEKEAKAKVREAISQAKQASRIPHRIQNLSLYCTFGYQHFFDGVVINLKDDPRICGYMFYLHNVTERYHIEAKLKDLNLELDSFVYKASHDLRAPLASLAGLINLTESDFTPKARENFEMMKKSVSKLDKFIQQLAHYSRNNNTEADYVRIDFEGLIEETIESYKHWAGSDKIHFEIKVDIQNPIVSDVFRLKIVLSNLISNAIKYQKIGQDYAYIKIVVQDFTKDTFSIVVEDNGQGINAQYIDKVFDMFVRATDQSDGSGLGLYIVQRALAKLKGKITVHSTKGVGSTFRVLIPHKISQNPDIH